MPPFYAFPRTGKTHFVPSETRSSRMTLRKIALAEASLEPGRALPSETAVPEASTAVAEYTPN